MKQLYRMGGEIDAATPDEVRSILNEIRPPRSARIRATQAVKLNGSGDGQDELYTSPIGFVFSLRRMAININTARDPVTGQVPLNVGGRYVAILRSGTWVEYPVLVSPTGISQVPGVATWSNDEEPYFRNGEVVEVQMVGLTPYATVVITVDGMMKEDGY